MRFIDQTPFSTLCFTHTNARGEERWVVIVRATYAIGPRGALTRISPQPALELAELGFGDPLTGPLRRESDLAPEKPRCDVIVHANAHAPEGKPSPRFDVALAIRDGAGARLADRRLMVTGPRDWRRQGVLARGAGAVMRVASVGLAGGDGYTLSDPEPTLEVPLRFDHAYGGTVRLDDGTGDRPALIAHEGNPIGRGLIPSIDAIREALGLGIAEARDLRSSWAARNPRVPAPQIELPGRPLGASAGDDYPLAGWGIVGKHWETRLARAGTFDAAWLRDRHPILPADFDPGYWNGAHPDLQLDEVPVDARLTLAGLVPVSRDPERVVHVDLPGMRAEVETLDVRAAGPEVKHLRLDTITVDLLEDQLTLVYRANLPAPPGLAYIHLRTETP